MSTPDSDQKSWILECLRELTEDHGLNVYFTTEQIAAKANITVSDLGDFINETGPLWELYHDDHKIAYCGNSKEGYVFAARGSMNWDD